MSREISNEFKQSYSESSLIRGECCSKWKGRKVSDAPLYQKISERIFANPTFFIEGIGKAYTAGGFQGVLWVISYVIDMWVDSLKNPLSKCQSIEMKTLKQISEKNPEEEIKNECLSVDAFQARNQAAKNLFGSKRVELESKDISHLSDQELFIHYQNVVKESKRIGLLRSEEKERAFREEVCDCELEKLAALQNRLKTQFKERVAIAREKLEGVISPQAMEAEENLKFLQSELEELEEEHAEKREAVNKEALQIETLKKGQEEIAQKIGRVRYVREQKEKKCIDPFVQQALAQTERMKTHLEGLESEKARLNFLENKLTQIQKGEKEKEGWFGQSLSRSETKEYEQLVANKSTRAESIADVEKTLSNKGKWATETEATLREQHLRPSDEQIRQLERESQNMLNRITHLEKKHKQRRVAAYTVAELHEKKKDQLSDLKNAFREETRKILPQLRAYATAFAYCRAIEEGGQPHDSAIQSIFEGKIAAFPIYGFEMRSIFHANFIYGLRALDAD